MFTKTLLKSDRQQEQHRRCARQGLRPFGELVRLHAPPRLHRLGVLLPHTVPHHHPVQRSHARRIGQVELGEQFWITGPLLLEHHQFQAGQFSHGLFCRVDAEATRERQAAGKQLPASN